MKKPTLSEFEYEEGIGWNGKVTLLFGGRQYGISVLIQVDEDEGIDITKKQHEAFDLFMEKWDSNEPILAEALINYYNQEEKYSYGPDNEEQAATWWPDINTYEELINAVTPETIVILPDYLMETGRRIYLLFDRTWGGEDLDDNGIGVCFINEKIAKIGYKEIAF